MQAEAWKEKKTVYAVINAHTCEFTEQTEESSIWDHSTTPHVNYSYYCDTLNCIAWLINIGIFLLLSFMFKEIINAVQMSANMEATE